MTEHEVAGDPAEATMSVRVREESSALVLTVDGEMGAGHVPLLRSSLEEAARTASGRGVVLDLTGAAFIDSACLGVVVRGHKAVRAAGSALSLVVTPGPVRRVLEITGLDQVLLLEETLDAALRRVSASGS